MPEIIHLLKWYVQKRFPANVQLILYQISINKTIFYVIYGVNLEFNAGLPATIPNQIDFRRGFLCTMEYEA